MNITDTTGKKFYVTTPIYYVTAQPHLGSLYSTLLADVATRWYTLRGAKTFFLTGTDEHGQKVAQAAYKAGQQPQAFVDTFVDTYKDMWHKYNIDYSYFIRTTDQTHVKAVQAWITRLLQNGDIYKSKYQGFYCTPCETYLTEKESLKKQESAEPLCMQCRRETRFVSEESYFFKLSAYQDKLLEFYEMHPDFITPSERLAEVISFVKAGLKDLSISRTSVSWGIEFPGDTKHTTYVWADALNNYITAIGYGNPARQQDFDFWWPADMQILGKDIVRFHAVYWPAFLMASQLALPKKLLVHGWLKINNQKMSKSFGNVVDPQHLLNAYGSDSVRYYLTRHMAITQDSEFSIQDLEQRINADLANDLGNLLNRMITLAKKREVIEVKPPQNWQAAEIALRDNFWNKLELLMLDMEEGYFSRAYSTLWKFIAEVNAYFHAQEPWKITEAARFEAVISATAHSLYAIGLLIWPVMPTKAEHLLKSLGQDIAQLTQQDSREDKQFDLVEQLNNNPWNKTFMLNNIGTLFEKIVVSEQKAIDVATSQSQQSSASEIAPQETEQNIRIDDFAKVMLLVGRIERCTDVAKSNKLLQLSVDFGQYGTRQILSGIKKYFSCDDLISKQAVFVYNLTPRKMMGLTSHGMLLTAQNKQQDKLEIITPAESVPNGTRLQ